MTPIRVITIVLGILLIIQGIYCIATPVATFAALGWLIGVVMIVEGVGSALSWNDRRKLGFADGWTLAGAIVSIALGIAVICSLTLQLALDTFLAYLIATWLVIGGITRILAAVRLHSFDMGDTATLSSNWIVILIMGILLIIMGVLCLVNPLIAMAGVGTILGITIIVAGVSLIAFGWSR